MRKMIIEKGNGELYELNTFEKAIYVAGVICLILNMSIGIVGGIGHLINGIKLKKFNDKISETVEVEE